MFIREAGGSSHRSTETNAILARKKKNYCCTSREKEKEERERSSNSTTKDEQETKSYEKGLKELRQKLDHLKDIERPNASKAIGEARDKGDLSENAEYDAAKEAQGMLEMEISKLEETLSNARIIDESKLDSSKILIHSTVKIKNLTNSATMKYKLVAQSEANLAQGKISVDSPIGKGLLGKKNGDIAEIAIPNGNVKFEILEISR